MAIMEHISLEVSENIATITLNRPEALNAFTTTMQHELIEAFDQCDADDDVRVIIITGAGRGFCAGMDLAAGKGTFDNWNEDGFPRDGGGTVVLRMFDSKKPIIAAINGPAVGVGITMPLAADIRIASTEAKMGFVFTRRGLVPESCSSWFLPRLVPMQRAMEWVLTGRVFSAQEALENGLVRSLHAPDELLDEARSIAREIADNASPVSAVLARQMLWRMLGADHPMKAHEIETYALRTRGKMADAAEGVTSFLEKRPAKFPNRVSTDLPEIWSTMPTPEYKPVKG